MPARRTNLTDEQRARRDYPILVRQLERAAQALRHRLHQLEHEAAEQDDRLREVEQQRNRTVVAYLHQQAHAIHKVNGLRRAKGLKIVNGEAIIAKLVAFTKTHGGELPLMGPTVQRLRRARLILWAQKMKKMNGGLPMPKGQKIALKVVKAPAPAPASKTE